MKHKQYEADEQRKLFQWCDFAKNKYPELELLYHIPNGGSRNKIEAHNLKLQGVKAGVPDLCLPVPRGKYHGMYIEMKYGKNKPTTHQNWWLSKIFKQGYSVQVCYSWEEASISIIKYLEMR